MKEELGLTLILAREEGEGADYRFDELADGAGECTPPPVDIQPDDDFCIVYTSGSTGNPKGVILTHRGCLSTLMSWAFIASVVKEARGGESLFGDNPGILLAVLMFNLVIARRVFPPSLLGKATTAVHLVMIVWVIGCNYLRIDHPWTSYLLGATVVLVVASALHYLYWMHTILSERDDV